MLEEAQACKEVLSHARQLFTRLFSRLFIGFSHSFSRVWGRLREQTSF